MPLDGLRAWIGEVERKLGMRTRVFLVLATIAIGGAGAAIYLAVDTREDAVSEGDVRELQERLEGQAGTGSVAGQASVTQLEAELNALEAEVERLDGGRASEAGGGSGESPDVDGSSGGAGGGGLGTAPEGRTKLQELIERAKERKSAEENE
ncbi:MAG TPA: hypothetical protein VF729_01180 [Solirubrobacterales bacterium]